MSRTTDERIAAAIEGALEAEAGGKPDWPSRLRAAELLLRLRGRGDAVPEGPGETVIRVERQP